MRSRPDVAVLLIALLLAPPALAAAQAQPGGTPPAADGFERSEITRALETVKADPNLSSERTLKTLRWKVSDAPPSAGRPAWLEWIGGLFRWLEQSARLLVWCLAIVLAGLVAVYITRTVRGYRASAGDVTFVVPTHVRDLDIRPESLPDDIGGAARALWDRGEHRAALALLYRGMLSRLAHVHRVPIRDSSTEGDCLALAAGRVTDTAREYTARLVSVWQHDVYGGFETAPATVYGLCDGFAPALDRAASLDPLESGSAA